MTERPSDSPDCPCDLTLHRYGCPVHTRCRACGLVGTRRSPRCEQCSASRPPSDPSWHDLHMVTVGATVAAAIATEGNVALLAPLDHCAEAAVAFSYEVALDVLTANPDDPVPLMRAKYDALLERVRRILRRFATPATSKTN